MAIKLDGFTAEMLEDLNGLTAHMGKDDQPVFENLLTKNPKAARELAEGRMRQSDYDRKMNASKAEMDTLKKSSEEMNEWYKRNEPVHRKALEDLSTKDQELTTLRASFEKQAQEMAALVATKGGDVDQAQLEQAINTAVEGHAKKFGYVTQEEFNKISADAIVKQANEQAEARIKAAEDRLFKETVPALYNSAMDLAEIAVQHRTEFAEGLDRQKLSAYMTENNIIDPRKGYDSYIKPRRDEIAFNKRVEDEVKQRVSGMQVSGGNNGFSGGSPFEEMGVLQKQVQERQAAANGGSGTSAAAVAAAAELRAEGKL
jgi:hypothetical protein